MANSQDLSKRPRQKRSCSSEGRPFRITERDLWILEALLKTRFLTTSQCARLHFGGSKWAANKRLRKLLDARLVRVWVRNLAQENVYSLTRLGAKALEERNGDYGSLSIPRGLDGNLTHLFALNQVRISLALHLPQVGGEIAWWHSDWELRSRGREQVIPDALFVVRWERMEERTYALEVENQTRSPKRFLKKILAYASRKHRGMGLYGVSNFITLIVGLDTHWTERYRLQLGRTDLAWVWFTTLGEIQEKGGAGPIWKLADREEHYSLRALSFFPYSKEGSIGKASISAAS